MTSERTSGSGADPRWAVSGFATARSPAHYVKPKLMGHLYMMSVCGSLCDRVADIREDDGRRRCAKCLKKVGA